MPHDTRLHRPTHPTQEGEVTTQTAAIVIIATWLIAFAAVLWMFLTMSSERPPREPDPRVVALLALLVGLGGGWAIRLLAGS